MFASRLSLSRFRSPSCRETGESVDGRRLPLPLQRHTFPVVRDCRTEIRLPSRDSLIEFQSILLLSFELLLPTSAIYLAGEPNFDTANKERENNCHDSDKRNN